jgi:hypothetical protein
VQVWYHRLELNFGQPPWPHFVALVNKRFGLPLTDSPIGELALLCRNGSVDEFAKRFMALSYRDTAITEAHQVQLFIAGLDKPLRTDVTLQRPTTLDDAVMMARAYKQRDGLLPPPPSAPPSARTPPRATFRPIAASAPPPLVAASVASAPSVAKPTTNIRRLSEADVAQRRKDGQCFHCDEPYANGHKLVCKQLFSIEVLNDDTSAPTDDTTDPTISIHTLTGIRPRSGKTMQLPIAINRVRLTALLDYGSTHNFVDLEAAVRVGLQFSGRSGLQVAVANGDCIQSPGCCRNMPITIGKEQFALDCYGLALGSYEMVLGVQWLESLGPILWDFAKSTFTFIRDGHPVHWAATDVVTNAPALLTTEGDVMADLLLRFASMFTKP